MRKHQFPATIRQNALQINNFLGVDLTNSKSEVELNRSPDAQNLVLGQSGSLEKRLGLAQYYGQSQWIYSAIVDAQRRPRPVLGIFSHDVILTQTWAVDPYYRDVSYKIIFAYVGVDVAAYGNRTFNIWYRYNATWTMLTGDYTSANIIPLDNKNFLILGEYAKPKLLVFSNAGVGTLYNIWDKNIANYETYVYTPTTHIGRSPDGATTTEFEQINLASQYQLNTFVGDGTTAAYVCSDTINTADTKVWVRTGETWTLKTVTTHYTINTGNKTITFTAGNIPAEPQDGKDNVKIQFINSKRNIFALAECDVFGLFGLNNLNNYAFIARYSKERFFERKLPVYVGEFNYTDYPQTVKGYARYGEYQSVHCEKEIFIRSAALDAAGETIFPLKPSVSGVGILNGSTLVNYADQPLWVSEFGVTALSSGSLQYQTKNRGYYITGETMTNRFYIYDRNYFAFVFEDKYYLYNRWDGVFYVADKRYQYSERDTGNTQQFEWFKFAFPVKKTSDGNGGWIYDYFTGQCVDGNGYCLLSSTSGIYRFKVDSESNAYTDERYDYTDYDVNNLTPAWTDNTSYVVGDFRWSGSYAYRCIKEHTVASGDIPITNDLYWVRSISTSSIRIPVQAYWTTPVLNMGNISIKKTLKNVWVKLERYPNFSAKVYYSTQGLVKEKYDGYFVFTDIDFSRFTFSTDTDPLVIPINRQERKFMSLQLKIASDDHYPFTLLEILLKYTVNNQYKG